MQAVGAGNMRKRAAGHGHHTPSGQLAAMTSLDLPARTDWLWGLHAAATASSR
jgi:hypothetical protein